MVDNVEDLVLDLLEWLGPDPRPYGEVLDAWRTSCPRLPAWEEATSGVTSNVSTSRGAGSSLWCRPPGPHNYENVAFRVARDVRHKVIRHGASDAHTA
jgi:hypothetical protein